MSKKTKAKTDITTSTFRALIENSPESISLLNKKGEILYTNPDGYNLLGYNEEELIGKSGLKLVHPADIPKTSKALAQCLLNPGKHITVNCRCKHKSGTWLWLELTGTNLLHVPEVNAILLNARDVTEKEILKQKMGEEEVLLDTVLQQLPVGVIIVDAYTNKLIRANNVIFKQNLEYFTQINHLNSEDYKILNKRGEEYKPDQMPTRLALKGKNVIDEELYFEKLNEFYKILSLSASPIRDLSKKIVAVVLTIRDITQQKEHEKQKDMFIGIASHELKNPITSIKAFTQLLLKKLKNDDHSKNMLLRMDDQIEKLNTLITDLLNLSRIQAGKIEFHKSTFDLNKLIREAVNDIQHSTEKHKITIEGKVNKKVYGDKNKIYQVVVNLINNAIKYSPESDKVFINLRQNKNTVNIDITDLGIGMDKSIKNKIFSPYFQATESNGNSYKGLGIGLYISKEIIAHHNGKIDVKSEVGKGSTFSIILPIKKA
jgi:PAS domain S-box-containing protein